MPAKADELVERLRKRTTPVMAGAGLYNYEVNRHPDQLCTEAAEAIQSLSTKAEELAACLEKARELLKAMYESEPKEPYELVFDDCLIAQEIDAALEKWRQR